MPILPSKCRKNHATFSRGTGWRGRIKIGNAVTFPSLFAHIEYNAVTALTACHLLKLDEFVPEILTNGIQTSLEYIRRVHSKDQNVRYGALVNYLPPAGSTVVHPHMQAFASGVPIQKIDELIEASQTYFGRWRSNYWADLIDIEKSKNQRYLGRIETSEWILPFSPTGFYEVNAILPHRTNLLNLTGDDISNIAEGLSRILSYYKANSIWSFNIVVYSGPFGVESEYFAVNLKVVARYGFTSKLVNDRWSLPFLLKESEVFEAPEPLTPIVKKYFFN